MLIKEFKDLLVDLEKNSFKVLIHMGSINNKWLSTSLLDNNNYETILNCFINDVLRVEEMLDDYLNNKEIDQVEFDYLCDNLYQTYISDAAYEDEGDGMIIRLNSHNLQDYKRRVMIKNESDEEVKNGITLSKFR